MNTKYLFLILTVIFTLMSCEDSEENSSAILEVSQSSFNNISSDGETIELSITSNSSWTASTSSTWCIISPKEGNGNQKISLDLQANLESASRTATVTISAKGIDKTIQLSQDGSDIPVEEYHYNLPVIFHVFYKKQSDPFQHVNAKRLSEILDVVNKLYKDASKSVDMNLTFMLATTNPNGETLQYPGVEYIQWTEDYPIDCEAFMTDNSKKYVKYLWDPNMYINVMIYNFAADKDTESTTLGISHLPFSTTGSTFLEGLTSTKNTYISLNNLQFSYCVSINSLYINVQSTDRDYFPADVTVTLAHELGHYLGLHHVFSEGSKGEVLDGCEDTDYCEDTPSYDKKVYDADYTWAVSGNIPEDQLYSYLVKRTNCSGGEFTSYNIMDYAVSHSNQFTEDQRRRIRHVLTYSPLIPGPKKGKSSPRLVHDGPLDLPIRVIK